MKRFNDKVIILTGADSSIGKVTAIALARNGANVVLIGTDTKVLEHIASELPEDHTWINSGNHLTITCDITNAQQGEKLVSYITDKYNKIDGLININSDVKISQAMLNELLKTKGNIVNVSLPYNTSAKWSIDSYKEIQAQFKEHITQLAIQYGAQEVRVNGVYAGLTTENIEDVENVRTFIEQSLMGRLVTLDEISESVLFLASHDASMLTGNTLLVDGGLSLTS
ncbi:SDR family oxidoreductase [Psychrobacter sp.]|uniref:SDR family NAD(P)-dependent oxidoreductase n=1 Tax=Psychrobacter sp. TaxID=56811 RepID=UPI0025E86ACB|nr:SDR family oxidoreductase [Psychrobacter sp.]